jgi:hypothetical protein
MPAGLRRWSSVGSRPGRLRRRPAAADSRWGARRAVGVGVVVAGLVVVLLPGPGGVASAEGPVEEAREAARRVPFSARVEVSWVDREGLHTAELGIRAVGGRIRVQGPAAEDGDGGGPRVIEDDGEVGGLLAPALERTYELVRQDGPTVAGRPTELLLLRRDGELRERLAIDEATGLVLLREVYGSEGKPVRIVRVLELETAPVAQPAAGAATRSDQPRFLSVSRLSSRYPAPASLDGGYRRVGAYRHSRGVQLLYSDGLHGLSLFTEPGPLAPGALPGGGEPVWVGRTAAVHYTWPGGEVITWESGRMVHTLVGDGTTADLLAAAASVPPPGRPSVLDRVRATSRTVAELISGGR